MLTIWIVTAIPLLIGHPRCTFARFLHYPCPGCGLTRAAHLLASGRITESLAMQPLLVPILSTTIAFAACTVWLTWKDGTPFQLWQSRLGRAVVWTAATVHGGAVLLWVLRAIGLFGGPVAV